MNDLSSFDCEPLMAPQSGEAKVVNQDIRSYEKTREAMAILKILALGNKQVEDGKVILATDVIQHLRQKT